MTSSRIAGRFAVLSCAAIALAPGGARAQPSERDAPIAQALFDAARTLMSQDQYGAACAKLSESQRLDPASGTLLNLAVCHEKQGKTASAWVEYNDLLSLSKKEGNVERQRIAADRIRQIEPSLSHVSILPAPGSPAGDPIVKLDAVEVGAAALGVPIPIDPGLHVVEAWAPRHKPWSRTVGPIDKGASEVVRVPVLEDDPAASSRDRAPADRRQQAAYAAAALGLASFGAAGYFGWWAKTEWDTRNDHCGTAGCDQRAVEASKQAKTFALVSDGAVGLGLVATGVAVYLLLTPTKTTAPPRSSIGAWVAPDRVAVGYRGEF